MFPHSKPLVESLFSSMHNCHHVPSTPINTYSSDRGTHGMETFDGNHTSRSAMEEQFLKKVLVELERSKDHRHLPKNSGTAGAIRVLHMSYGYSTRGLRLTCGLNKQDYGTSFLSARSRFYSCLMLQLLLAITLKVSRNPKPSPRLQSSEYRSRLDKLP
ncbi:hypothetical protein K435DRAFT_802117 [Dendrothele bispora CBS 962.96]|uniref:Uncharacterized protein n=1 Tax=Dendrothele bispora (strain CBS 962.96) TaxID=1314807 RepID=A0A4S8LM42_DENBC|nr:hypothetical protein K435DRAFT_802117 [Dendrothele bispora CBS 962.96]